MTLKTRQRLIYSAAIVIALFALILALRPPPAPEGPTLDLGGPRLPELTADEWLLGDPPGPDELRGKVVVIDCWFASCIPCQKAAPGLVQTHRNFRTNDEIVFLGLNPHTETEDGEAIRAFLQRYRITWPNGIGARETLEQKLGVHEYPTVLVAGPNGRIVWRGHPSTELEEIINLALEIEALVEPS